MIRFLFILGLAFGEKLDRTYLPPPGSKLSGGSNGAIQVPFEDSKLQHNSAKDEFYNPLEIAIGIDRVAPKRPVDTIINNPSTQKNIFIDQNTTSPLNTDFLAKNIYPTTTVNTVHHSYDSNNIEIPNYPRNYYNNQFDQTSDSDSNKNNFPVTENYPFYFQGNLPISGESSDFDNTLLSNQSKPYSDQGIINGKSESSASPQSVPDVIIKQYNPYEYYSSSIPLDDSNSILVSSTVSSSLPTGLSSTKDNRILSNYLQPAQFSTASPISSTKSPVYNYANIRKHPERIQAQADREASILNYESSISPEGYAYTYDTSNGIHADENGVTINGVKAKGSYSYIGDDGKLYSVVYTADEYGFQPHGDHLPTSPPIPDAILKVIEQVSKEKEAGIFDDGSYDENKYGYRNYHNGFHSPKNGYYNIPSGVKQHNFNKNIIKINPNKNDKGVRNEVINNYKTETGPNQNFINNQIYSSNIDPYRVSEDNVPFDIKNTPDHKHVSYEATDLKTGEENDQSLDKSKASGNKVISEDENTQLVNKQISFGDVGKDFSGTVGENKPNEYSKEDLYIETGYHYNPPQYTESTGFSPRFSDVYNTKNEILKQRNYSKDTPKPFQTPYVMQTNEESEIYNDDRPLQSLDSDPYEDEQLTNKKFLFPKGEINENNENNFASFSGTETGDNPPGQLYQIQVTDVYDKNPEILNKGHGSKLAVPDSDKRPYGSIITDRHYTSTAIPNELNSRLNANKPNYISDAENALASNPKSIFPSTSYNPNEYQTTIKLNKTNQIPDYSSIAPEYNENGDIISIKGNLGLPDASITTPRTEFSTNIPNLGNSYAPNLDLVHTGELTHTTERVIGEEFSGPKQLQKFDPLTGYYY